MRFAKTIVAVAACALATAPVLANSAAKLSVAGSQPVRASTEAGKSNKAAGGYLIPLVSLIAIGLGVYVAVDSEDEPASP